MRIFFAKVFGKYINKFYICRIKLYMGHLTQIKERVSAEKEIPTYKYHYKKWVFNEWLKKENIKK